jgi:hypothetical protein
VTELVDRAGWESRHLPRGDLHCLVSPANATARAFHAEVTAQVDTSAKAVVAVNRPFAAADLADPGAAIKLDLTRRDIDNSSRIR